MPLDFIKFAYSAGELSEDLHGRGDLGGFQAGYRDGMNVLVDWRGSIRTRPGTEFCEPLFEDSANPGVRLSTFSFNTDAEDNYLLVWLHEKLRFVQDGAYLEVTHGERNPDLAGALWRVYNGGGQHIYTGQGVSAGTLRLGYRTQASTRSSGFRYSKVLELETPYDHEHLKDLKFSQFRDEIIITHRSYAPRKLQRALVNDVITWELQEVNFPGAVPVGNKRYSTPRRNQVTAAERPVNLKWTVASVDTEGFEVPVAEDDYNYIGVSERSVTVEGSALIIEDTGQSVDLAERLVNMAWDRREGAEHYKVYASEPSESLLREGVYSALPHLMYVAGQLDQDAKIVRLNPDRPTASGGELLRAQGVDTGEEDSSVPISLADLNNDLLMLEEDGQLFLLNKENFTDRTGSYGLKGVLDPGAFNTARVVFSFRGAPYVLSIRDGNMTVHHVDLSDVDNTDGSFGQVSGYESVAAERGSNFRFADIIGAAQHDNKVYAMIVYEED